MDEAGFHSIPESSGSGLSYNEFLRAQTMSAGTYRLPAGATDPQSPHQEDEIYYVIGGRASFTAGDETKEIGPRDVLFVPATMEHRFHDIAEDLTLLVVFAPPESG